MTILVSGSLALDHIMVFPDRFKDHLQGGSHSIPGVKMVVIEQHNSIAEARKAEGRIISRSKPKHNKQGK